MAGLAGRLRLRQIGHAAARQRGPWVGRIEGKRASPGGPWCWLRPVGRHVRASCFQAARSPGLAEVLEAASEAAGLQSRNGPGGRNHRIEGARGAHQARASVRDQRVIIESLIRVSIECLLGAPHPDLDGGSTTCLDVNGNAVRRPGARWRKEVYRCSDGRFARAEARQGRCASSGGWPMDAASGAVQLGPRKDAQCQEGARESASSTSRPSAVSLRARPVAAMEKCCHWRRACRPACRLRRSRLGARGQAPRP